MSSPPSSLTEQDPMDLESPSPSPIPPRQKKNKTNKSNKKSSSKSYPVYPRSLPAIPDSLITTEVLGTADYVNELLEKFNRVAEHGRKVQMRKGQTWDDDKALRMERKLWVNMCPMMLLGTLHIKGVILQKRGAIFNGSEKAAFTKETEVLKEFHHQRRSEDVARETLRPYIYNVEAQEQPSYVPLDRPSEYTELRCAFHKTCIDKIRAVDENKRLQKYMSYIFEAEKEWMMIKRYRDHLTEMEDDFAEKVWSDEFIEQQLAFLSKAKKLHETRESDNEDEQDYEQDD
ncbi:hypothetical protein LTS15_000006 [Exophiala xenobiotica]|nr:hypothetical protein LTS15_000006 [Exophiala xenobiotica]